MSRDGVTGTRVRAGVDNRGGSNGGTDLMTPFFRHGKYRLLHGALALEEMRTLEKKHPGVFDLSDPAAPALVRACRRCQEPQRMPLVSEATGEVVFSPMIVRLLGFLICETCEAEEDAQLATTRQANSLAARVSASGLTAAMVKDAAKGWDDVVLRGRSADDGNRRREAIVAARAWAEAEDESARGVWVHGPAGTGKSRLLAVAAYAKLQRLQVRWVNVAVLITQLEGSWNDADRQAGLKVLTDPGVLVLDDLAQVVPTPRVQAALFTALEARDKAGVGVCVSSNEKPSEVAAMFSSPFVSRLVKLANPMPFPGPDLRLELVK
jgi:DNA replication protein DnaC